MAHVSEVNAGNSTLVAPPRGRRQNASARVVRALEDFCDAQQPGDRIPTHTELMRQLNAPERVVLGALGELKRRGRIERRKGSGTFVADPVASTPIPTVRTATTAKTIVVIAKPDHGFFDHCVEQLYTHVDRARYNLVCQFLGKHDTMDGLEPILSQAAGFIVFHNSLDTLAVQLMNAGNRVVRVGVPSPGSTLNLPSVYGDHETGGYLAVSHVIGLGHRRIAFPLYDPDQLQYSRWEGHRRAIQEARDRGLGISETIIEKSRLDQWCVDPTSAMRFFAGPDAPTALVFWNDFQALELMEILSRAGIRFPDDLSIVGYDNMPAGATKVPQLTTVDGALHQQLSAAVTMLLSPTAAAPTTSMIAIPTLVVRESSARPKNS